MSDIVQLLTLNNAIAFGTGCGAGYGFAVRTAVKNCRERVAELSQEVHEMRGELKSLQKYRIEDLKDRNNKS